MLTQQAGHLEFGSFEFEFDRPSTQFTDLRPKFTAPPEYHDHDHGHEGHHEQAAVTELTRFFKLFPNKRLALDIFAIVESARVEARIMQEYRGIAVAYSAMRRRTLTLRQESIFLPAREALLEFMMRLSLGRDRWHQSPQAAGESRPRYPRDDATGRRRERHGRRRRGGDIAHLCALGAGQE